MNPLFEQDLSSLVLLNRLFSGSIRKVQTLFREGRSPSEIVTLIENQDALGKRESLLLLRKSFNPEMEIEKCHQQGVGLLTFFSSNYPQLLKNIIDPPLVLYYRGSFDSDDQNAISIVGTRHPSIYGMQQARRFAHELSEMGLTIVSGLARGIDQIAHEAALEIPYGRTIAVMGCGLDQVYPKSNSKLFERIIEQGVVISEFGLGVAPFAGNFPKRNRIISGLSYGTLVIEAHSRSGSLITANCALDQNREVFAIPGPIDQITSRGTNHLIKEGAYAAESPQDVFEEISSSIIHNQETKPFPSFLPELEPKSLIVEKTSSRVVPADSIVDLLNKGPLFYEEIGERCRIPIDRLALRIMDLETKKIIQKSISGQFSLCN